MESVREGDIAVIDYHASVVNDDSEVLANESGRMRLRAGDNGAVCAIDVAVLGMTAGESKNLVVPPESGFGQRDPSLVMELPRSRFRRHPGLRSGCLVKLCSKTGKEIEVVTRRIDKKSVTVDANHPLAGMTLNFDITVHAIESGS